MMKTSKKFKKINSELDFNIAYEPDKALEILKNYSSKKFDESVDIAINLGIDPKKSDQAVRGSVVLPKGTGKSSKVIVFAQGDAAEKAKTAGADEVGFEDLADKVKSGYTDFDVVIATPDSMRIVGQLGQVLGPKGLMPNPKVGTVTPNVDKAVDNVKKGQVQFRSDKGGILHCIIGKLSFDKEDLIENMKELISVVSKLRPSSAKGIFVKKISLSSTMGQGLTIDVSLFK
jgi:large subunit ribosomal protein L1